MSTIVSEEKKTTISPNVSQGTTTIGPAGEIHPAAEDQPTITTTTTVTSDEQGTGFNGPVDDVEAKLKNEAHERGLQGTQAGFQSA